MNLLSRVLNCKWAIIPEALDVIIDIVSKENLYSSEDIAKIIHGQAWKNYIDENGKVINYNCLKSKNYPSLENTENVSIAADNVAILPVIGPIFPRSNLLTLSSGTSLQSISYDFNIALENENVNSIILMVDSPGGEVTGVSEFADMIYNARNKKNIISYIYGFGASAAYWIASAASEIVINPTTEVGSIGVIAGYTDKSKQNEKKGIEEIKIVSSQSPYKNADPKTIEGREQIQEVVDKIAKVFIDSVAKQRNITPELVIKNFGQGKLFVGNDAVKFGLVDRIGSLEGLIKEQNELNNSNNFNKYNLSIGGQNMKLNEFKEKHTDLYNEMYSIIENETLTTLQGEIEKAELKGREQENERIKEIEKLNVPGSQDLIKENKFNMEMTAEKLSIMIIKSQRDQIDKMNINLDNDGVDLAKQSRNINSSSGDFLSDTDKDKHLIKFMLNGMDGFFRKPVKV